MNHQGFVTGLSVSQDGRLALTVSDLATETQFRSAATLWDLRTGQGQILDQVIDQRNDQDESSSRSRRRITSATLDPLGQLAVVGRAATGDAPASIRVWRTDEIAARSRIGNSPVSSPQELDVNAGQIFQVPAVLGTPEFVLAFDDQTMLTMNKNAAFKWDLGTEPASKKLSGTRPIDGGLFLVRRKVRGDRKPIGQDLECRDRDLERSHGAGSTNSSHLDLFARFNLLRRNWGQQDTSLRQAAMTASFGYTHGTPTHERSRH